MKRIFAIILAVTVFAVSLPLAFLTGAEQPDFDTIFEEFENVAYKTYFDDNTAINTAGFVAGYDNVAVKAAGLGYRDGNYLKAEDATGGYVVIEVADNNAVETGLVVHKGQLTNSYLTFYTSVDNATWTEVPSEKIATSEALCTTVAPVPNTTDYYLRRQRFTDLPLGTKYLKVEITTSAAWQPGLDYIDLYAPSKFVAALEGYNATPVKIYFDDITAINTAGYVAGYHNVAVKAAGLGYRDGNYVKAESTAGGWVAIEVTAENLIEAGLVIHKDRLGDTSLDFYTSSDMIEWTKLSVDNIAMDQKVSEKNANYYLRRYRAFSLPEGTAYIKVVINTTQTWQPGLDYVDVYEPERFDEVLNGYEDSARKTYFDDNTAINTAGFVAGYNNVAVNAAGLGYRDGNYLKAEDAAGGWVTIEVDDTNVVETGLVIHKNRLLDSSLEFFTSPDNTEWTKVTLDHIATKQKIHANNADYYVRQERIFDLPEGTKYLKVAIKTTQTWQPGIDYIDVYSIDNFYSALNEYEDTPYKQYFENNTAVDTVGYVVAHDNVKVHGAGLGTREGNYLKANNTTGGYVVIKVDKTDAVETGLVIHKGQLNTTYLTFYTSRDNVNWTEVPEENITVSQKPCTTIAPVPNTTDYYLRRERIVGFPVGTKYLKVEITTATNWQPGLDYIDLYAKKGTSANKETIFASLTDGYEVVKSLINATETLDSKSVLSYKNWRYAKAGLNYRDEYSTQRPNQVNEDAEIVLSVTDDTVTEVGTVINESRLAKSFNKYYASADGKNWTELGEDSVYVKELTASKEKPAGYVGLNSGYVARIERVVRLPKGTTQLKIVTSTNNEANSWWQPGIEYIDIYEPILESKLSGYELDRELITETATLNDSAFADVKNWIYTENGVAFRDTYALTRQTADKAELILNVSENMPVETAFTVFAEFAEKASVTYYTSTDGNTWTKINNDAVVARTVTSLTDVGISEDYVALNHLIIGLDDSVKKIKIVVETESEVLAEDVQINYIKLYKEYIDPFDTVLDGYSIVETLLTTTNTIEAQSILSYKGWNKFGLVGMPFFDEVGTQRLSGDTADAEIIVSVDDKMAVEVATVIAKSLEGITSNIYYTSTDGKTWTQVSADNIYSKRFTKETDDRLTETTVGLIERIVGLPEGTTQLKIVTTTQNKVNSWWQPSINRIHLYKDPFDTAVDGCVEVDTLITPSEKLSSDWIVSYDNWSYSNKFSYKNSGGAVRKNTSNANMILSVVDTMTIEIATVASRKVQPHTYYVSEDGSKWTKLTAQNVYSRVFEASANNIATVERIGTLPEGTAYLKIVSSGNEEFSINYITFYDKEVDKFDLAFVGYGRTHSLFDSTRKLNDAVVISYSNWRYGKNGYTYIDEYSLQRESQNCNDAELVLSVEDNQALEFGAVISNSWLKKTKTSYYVSEDGTKWTRLADSSVISRYYTPEDDSRVSVGYSVLAERVVGLPEGTNYIKYVVSTGNEVNSWWQPGIDYVDIYTPYEELSLEQIAAQTGELQERIQFTSDEDGIKNSYIFSSKNIMNGKYGLSYTDEYSTRRKGYNDSEIILSVNEDSIIELGTLIDKSLEYCAENKFYTSVDGELWIPFDAGMLLNSRVTEGVADGMYAMVQLLSELPSDTKYVKIVGTTNGVTDSWKRFGIDYITIYKGESTFKVNNPMGDPQIMLVGNFMNITLKKSQKFTIDDLTDRLDSGKLLIYYYTSDDQEIFDGMTDVQSGQKLVLKRNNKSKKEYIISVTYIEDDPVAAIETPEKTSLPLIIGLAAGGIVIIVGVVLLILFLKRKKLAQKQQ